MATSASLRFSSSLAVRDLSVADVATIRTGAASPAPASPVSIKVLIASCASSPVART